MLYRTVFAVLCVLSVTVPALSQERRPYAGGGLTASTQGSERPGSSPSFPTSGVGGTAAGLVVDAGGYLATRLSVGFEASIPARFESIQETDYFLVFRTASQHRDVVLSGLFHVHASHGGRVGFAIVGGPAVVREDTLQRTAYKSGPPLGVTGDFGPFGPETSVARWTVGVTAGGDVAVRLGTHVSVVPQLRCHWIERAEAGEGDSGVLGLSSWVWRPAVDLRATF